MEYYSYVKCDYNNGDGFWCVDAWRTDDDNEEGKVVAYIHETTGDVAYAEPEARCSELVKEVVDIKVAEIKAEHEEDSRKLLALSVRVWVSFCNNFPNYKDIITYICGKTGKQYLVPHLQGKFENICRQYSSYAAIPVFYSDLDKDLRESLVDFAYRVYAPKSMYLSDGEKETLGI